MDFDTSKLEQEMADMQARESVFKDVGVKPSGFAKAMKEKKVLVEKVRNF